MTDDPLVDVLSEVARVLDEAAVEYAVTGSIASGLHGEPHASIDVDIACRMTPDAAERIAGRLPPRFYRNPELLRHAAETCGMANLIDQETGLKVDLSVLSPTPFHDTVLARRTRIPFGPGAPAFPFVTAEDVVLMKLEWRRTSESAKQWADALGVVRVRGARLDWSYLRRTAGELGLAAVLDRLRDEAGV